MRVLRDPMGREWEVVVGRESWGTVVAIFVPRGWVEPPRQALMSVSSTEEGDRLLLGMKAEELQTLLVSSKPKPTG